MTKERPIKNFVKVSHSLMYTDSISRRFDRFTGWSFEVSLSNFSLFCSFSQNLVRLSSFISYSLVTVLHLESFENTLLELDFSVSIKTCFYGQTFSGR